MIDPIDEQIGRIAFFIALRDADELERDITAGMSQGTMKKWQFGKLGGLDLESIYGRNISLWWYGYAAVMQGIQKRFSDFVTSLKGG